VERIVAASPGPDVLDVGTGTGIAGRQFQAAGCRVLGVDPDARMADFARRKGLEVEVATFEDLGSGGPDVRRGHRRDRPGTGWTRSRARPRRRACCVPAGGWRLLERVPAPPDLAEAFAAVYRRVLPDSPFPRGAMPGLDSYSAFFIKAAEGIGKAGAFGDPEQWRFDWDRAYHRDEWLDVVPTFGGHSQFPAAALEELLAGIGRAIDAVGGSFTMRYTAVVVTAARTVTA
jgi:SAM-dependent methyltransferase